MKQNKTRVTLYVWVSHEDSKDYFTMLEKMRNGGIDKDYNWKVQEVETDPPGDYSYYNGTLMDQHPGDRYTEEELEIHRQEHAEEYGKRLKMLYAKHKSSCNEPECDVCDEYEKDINEIKQ